MLRNLLETEQEGRTCVGEHEAAVKLLKQAVYEEADAVLAVAVGWQLYLFVLIDIIQRLHFRLVIDI